MVPSLDLLDPKICGPGSCETATAKTFLYWAVSLSLVAGVISGRCAKACCESGRKAKEVEVTRLSAMAKSMFYTHFHKLINSKVGLEALCLIDTRVWLTTSYDYSGLKCILLREEGCFCKQSFVCINEDLGRKSAYWNETTIQSFDHVSQLMVVRVSSCFGTESPTYDDAKEPLNNWRSNLNTLCSLPYMLVRITFHAKSYVMSLQFDHVTPRETFDNLWQKRPWTWVLQVLWSPFLGDALVEQQRIFPTLPTSPAQPWRFSVQVAETEAFEESTVPPGK